MTIVIADAMLFLVIDVMVQEFFAARQTLAVFNGMSNKSEVPSHSFIVTCFLVVNNVLSVSWQIIQFCQNGMVVRFRRRRGQRKVYNLIADTYLSFLLTRYADRT